MNRANKILGTQDIKKSVCRTVTYTDFVLPWKWPIAATLKMQNTDFDWCSQGLDSVPSFLLLFSLLLPHKLKTEVKTTGFLQPVKMNTRSQIKRIKGYSRWKVSLEAKVY